MNINMQSAGLILGFIACVVCVPVPAAAVDQETREFSLTEFAIIGECREPDLKMCTIRYGCDEYVLLEFLIKNL